MEFNKKTLLLSVILIIILGFSVYSSSLNGKFIWDDESLVRDNLYIRDWSNVGGLLFGKISTITATKYNFYRPLQMVTYLLDYSLWKLNVKGYHLTNILLHTLVALTIYWLINILYGDNLLSLFTSTFFIIHPIHTEVVSYISSRSNSLGALFMLLSFIFYLKLLDKERPGFYLLMLLSYIAGLLSRENTPILPILLVLYHLASEKRIKAKDLLAILIITLIYVLLRFTLLKDLLAGIDSSSTLLQRIPGFFVAIANYMRSLILPFGLHMEHGKKLFVPTDPRAGIGILILSLVLIYAITKRRSNKPIFFSISWFFITLLPVSNLCPLNAYMAESWLYVPSIGIFLFLANGFSFIYRKRQTKIISIFSIILLLFFYSYLTIKQNEYWKEPISFYERTLEYAPNSWRLYYNLGNEYSGINKKVEAISLYEKALEINADDADVYYNLGNAYFSVDKKPEAISSYKKALEISPDHLRTYNNLAAVYNAIGKREKAIALYKKALEISPDSAMVHNNLSIVYLQEQEYDLAIEYCDRAAELGFKVSPDHLENLKPHRK